MTRAERQIVDRRREAIAEWRRLGRRAEDRRRVDNIIVSRWLARFNAARLSLPPAPVYKATP